MMLRIFKENLTLLVAFFALSFTGLLCSNLFGELAIPSKDVKKEIDVKKTVKPVPVLKPVPKVMPVFPANIPQAEPEAPTPAKQRSPTIRITIPIDGSVTRTLDRASKQIDEKDYDLAVETLQSLLDSSEDYRGENSTLSLRQMIERQISQFPKTAMETYVRDNEPKASELLRTFDETSDVQVLAEASRRFLNTPSGAKATWLHGRFLADQSQFYAASICFERLLASSNEGRQFQPMLSVWLSMCCNRLDNKKRADEVLSVFEKNDTLSETARTFLTANRATEKTMIRDWNLPRGNVFGQGSVEQVLPILDSSWVFDAFAKSDFPYEFVKEKLESLIKADANRAAQGHVLIPAIQPIVIGETAVVPTVSRLKAFNVVSGKLLWESAYSNETFEFLMGLEKPKVTSPEDENQIFEMAMNLDTPLHRYLSQRAWTDSNSGSLSSDGKRVFHVSSRGVQGMNTNSSTISFFQGAQNHPFTQVTWNRLVAYDLNGGKLIWELGGARDGFQRTLAGVFFLGPPLPYQDKLFVLGEFSKEVNLIQIDPLSGDVDWVQPLTGTELGVQLDVYARFNGFSPIVADGVLLCPTSAGSVIAFDLTTRSILWESLYLKELPSNITFNKRSRVQSSRYSIQKTADRNVIQSNWVGFQLLSSQGYAVLTSSHFQNSKDHGNTPEFVCIDMKDGSIIWRKPRGNNLFVGCVYNGHVVMVGPHHIVSLNLATGDQAWEKEIFQTAVSGRGVRDGNRLHLPLESQDVLTLSLDDGNELCRSPVGASQKKLGNLVAARGRLVSANIHQAFAFDATKDVLDDLDESPTDEIEKANLLSLKGQVQLISGNTEQGLQSLLASDVISRNRKTSRLISNVILEGISNDFEKYETIASERLPTIENQADQFQMLLFFVKGLKKQNRHPEIVSKLFEYVDRLGLDYSRKLYPVSQSHRVLPSRWVRAEFLDVLKTGDESVRNLFEEEVAKRIEQASKSKGKERFAVLLRFLPNVPAVIPAHKELLSRLSVQNDVLEYERHLMWLEKFGAESEKAFATAKWLELLASHLRVSQAETIYQELSTRYQNVDCGGFTGAQVCKAFDERFPEQVKAFNQNDYWLEKQLEAKMLIKSNSTLTSAAVISKQKTGLFAQDWNFAHDISNSWLARNRFGALQWKFQNPDASPGSSGRTTASNYSRIRQFGHLAFASNNQFIYAINTLTGNPKSKVGAERFSKLVWAEEQAEPFSISSQTRALFGRTSFNSVSYTRRRSEMTLSNIDLELMCVQRGKNLAAIDPWTGETLWVRDSVFNSLYEIKVDQDRVLLRHPVPVNATGTYVTTPAKSFQSSTQIKIIVQGKEFKMDKPAPILSSDVYFSATDGSDTEIKTEEHSRRRTLARKIYHDSERSVVFEKGAVAWFVRSERIADSDQVQTEWDKEIPVKSRIYHAPSFPENIACVEYPNRELWKLDLLSGEMKKWLVVDAATQQYPVVDSIYVSEDEDRYFVLEFRKPFRSRITVSVTGFTNYVHGNVHCISKSNDEVLWSKAIENQALVPNQPNASPVVVFSATQRTYQSYRTVNGKTTRQRATSKKQIMMLDKKDGSVLYEDKTSSNSSFTHRIYSYEIDPEEDICTIGFQKDQLVIRRSVSQSIIEDLKSKNSAKENEKVSDSIKSEEAKPATEKQSDK